MIQQQHFIPKLVYLPSKTLLFLDKLNLEVFTSKQKLSLFLCTKTPKQKLLYKNIVSTPFQLISFKCYTYNLSNFLFSTSLIASYISFLLKQKIALRKLITFISFTIKNELGKKKIVVTTYGPVIFKLKGFKITISGRFEASSTQMSKTLKQSSGLVPLVSINDYIEFTSIPVFFKLGSCNLKI